MSAPASPRCGFNTTALALAFMIYIAAPARASLVMYETPKEVSIGGHPVSAEALFVTSANSVQVILTNMQSDPDSAAQCLSGLEFRLDHRPFKAKLLSSSGAGRDILSTGGYFDSSMAPVGWKLKANGAKLILGNSGWNSSYGTIVGPPNGSDVYSSTAMIESNDFHLAPTATFMLNVWSVTAASTVSSVRFYFNTRCGNTVAGVVAPEPCGLCMLTFATLCGLRRVRGPVFPRHFQRN